MSVETNLETIFQQIEANRQAFIDRLMAYLRQPSISAHGLGITETADFLVTSLQEIGMDAKLLHTTGHPFVYARRDDVPGAPTVLLYGHYDVQPADPLEEWTSPPFEPEILDGRIWARGVGDNKGQHFAQMLALETWMSVAGKLPCNVVMLLEGEEEIGSPHIAECVAANRHLLDHVDLVVTADGPVHESGLSTLKFGPRGMVGFELRVRHAARDFHSGNWGGVAPNPIWTLVQLLATMKNPNGDITIDGFYDGIEPPTKQVRDALDALPVDLDRMQASVAMARLDHPLDRAYHDRLSLWPTFTINGFHSGYGGPGTKTVLPCEAFVKCDMRLIEPQSCDDIFQKVEAHVARHAPEVEFVRQGHMEPSSTPLNSPYTKPIQKAFRLAQGKEALLTPPMGGSLPDYVWTKILGVHSFATPYGNHDQANHAPNENMEISRFIDGIRTGAALLASLSEIAPAAIDGPGRKT